MQEVNPGCQPGDRTSTKEGTHSVGERFVTKHLLSLGKISKFVTMSKTAIFVHLVFATKHRERTLLPEGRERLYRYMVSILKAKHCHACEIGGVTDHIHVLMDLHPSVALADLVRELKTSSAALLKRDRFLTYFDGWADGYYAGSISPSHKTKCEDYIRNQETHHQGSSIEDEMELMASKYGFIYHADDWR